MCLVTSTATMIKVAHRLDAADLPPRGPVLCDLDGCLVSDGMAFPDAHAFVASCAERLWIVSNNSTDRAVTLSARLEALGWALPPQRILLAGEQTVHHLCQTHPNASLAIYATEELQRLALDLGMVLDNGHPDIVLLCRDMQFNLNKLDRLTRQIADGAVLWIANLDQSHPSQTGYAVAETGALLAAVTAVLGDIPVRCLGKPDPHLAQIVFDHVGASASDAIFIGDNSQTDGALAKAAGIPFLHIDRKRRPQ